MFKNAMLFRFIMDDGARDLRSYDGTSDLELTRFVECGPSQDRSLGWIGLRSENDSLIESVGGHLLMRACIEAKSVPVDVLNREVDKIVKTIEANEGRKPGRKEMRGIREDCKLDLLPFAFPSRKFCNVWVDPGRGTIVLDAGSQGVANEVITMLVRTFAGLSIRAINTQRSPASAMCSWLADQESMPSDFHVGRSVELKANDELKAKVKFDNHHLDQDKMIEHISQGKLPTKLDLDYQGRVSFTLTEGMSLRKIKFLDVVFENGDDEGVEGVFEVDVALTTGELGPVIDGLIGALGGELV